VSNIHSTAIVDPAAHIDSTATVGPYAVIGPHVRIGARSSVGPHCVIEGHTSIGEDNKIFQFASLGAQFRRTKSMPVSPRGLEIGNRNTIREFCTFNLGTAQDRGVTSIGDDNWIMAYVHIAHDCVVGNQTILANNATLAGHVQLGDWVIVGGLDRRAPVLAHWRPCDGRLCQPYLAGCAAFHDGRRQSAGCARPECRRSAPPWFHSGRAHRRAQAGVSSVLYRQGLTLEASIAGHGRADRRASARRGRHRAVA
jgi:carbonic anhydrase/acetyltransferase-like protein (isoleucine patch superfamily)